MNQINRRLVALLVLAGAPLAALPASAQTPGCTIGVSLVACAGTTRTFIVAKTGAANYRWIQQALDAAMPGDTILVRAGTYVEPVLVNASGTPLAPVTLKAYPGERPVLQPQSAGQSGYVGLLGSWLVLDGFEISRGQHGVVIKGSHNIVRNNHVHENGQGCRAGDRCGQGIIIASASDVVIENNQIERNGLDTSSPWHVHGIYLSNYYGRSLARISILGNVLREHGGAGLQVWDSQTAIDNVIVRGNRFENNDVEAIFTNLRDGVIKENEFRHFGHPATNAPRSAILWLEFCQNLTFEANTFRYNGVAAHGVPSVLIHLYDRDQDLRELEWLANTWDLPSSMPVTDAYLNSLGR